MQLLQQARRQGLSHADQQEEQPLDAWVTKLDSHSWQHLLRVAHGLHAVSFLPPPPVSQTAQRVPSQAPRCQPQQQQLQQLISGSTYANGAALGAKALRTQCDAAAPAGGHAAAAAQEAEARKGHAVAGQKRSLQAAAGGGGGSGSATSSGPQDLSPQPTASPSKRRLTVSAVAVPVPAAAGPAARQANATAATHGRATTSTPALSDVARARQTSDMLKKSISAVKRHKQARARAAAKVFHAGSNGSAGSGNTQPLQVREPPAAAARLPQQESLQAGAAVAGVARSHAASTTTITTHCHKNNIGLTISDNRMDFVLTAAAAAGGQAAAAPPTASGADLTGATVRTPHASQCASAQALISLPGHKAPDGAAPGPGAAAPGGGDGAVDATSPPSLPPTAPAMPAVTRTGSRALPVSPVALHAAWADLELDVLDDEEEQGDGGGGPRADAASAGAAGCDELHLALLRTLAPTRAAAPLPGQRARPQESQQQQQQQPRPHHDHSGHAQHRTLPPPPQALQPQPQGCRMPQQQAAQPAQQQRAEELEEEGGQEGVAVPAVAPVVRRTTHTAPGPTLSVLSLLPSTGTHPPLKVPTAAAAPPLVPRGPSEEELLQQERAREEQRACEAQLRHRERLGLPALGAGALLSPAAGQQRLASGAAAPLLPPHRLHPLAPLSGSLLSATPKPLSTVLAPGPRSFSLKPELPSSRRAPDALAADAGAALTLMPPGSPASRSKGPLAAAAPPRAPEPSTRPGSTQAPQKRRRQAGASARRAGLPVAAGAPVAAEAMLRVWERMPPLQRSLLQRFNRSHDAPAAEGGSALAVVALAAAVAGGGAPLIYEDLYEGLGGSQGEAKMKEQSEEQGDTAEEVAVGFELSEPRAGSGGAEDRATAVEGLASQALGMLPEAGATQHSVSLPPALVADGDEANGDPQQPQHTRGAASGGSAALQSVDEVPMADDGVGRLLSSAEIDAELELLAAQLLAGGGGALDAEEDPAPALPACLGGAGPGRLLATDAEEAGGVREAVSSGTPVVDPAGLGAEAADGGAGAAAGAARPGAGKGGKASGKQQQQQQAVQFKRKLDVSVTRGVVGASPPGAAVTQEVEVGLYADIKKHEKGRRSRLRADGPRAQGARRPVHQLQQCKYHWMGKCTKGATCSFLHTDPAEPVPLLIPCKAFASGQGCGSTTCPFAHAPGMLGPCMALITKGACPAPPGACPHQHMYTDAQRALLFRYYKQRAEDRARWQARQQEQQQQAVRQVPATAGEAGASALQSGMACQTAIVGDVELEVEQI